MSALGREAAIAVFDYSGLGAQSGVGAWTGHHAKVQESSAYCSAEVVALDGQMAPGFFCRIRNPGGDRVYLQILTN